MTRRIAAHRAGGAARTLRMRMRRIVALLGTVIVAATGIIVLTSPASAATRAYGFEGSTGWLGTVTAQDGTRSICVNPIGLFPSGTTTYVGLVSAIDAQTAASNGGYGGTAYTTGAAVQELNYALGVWVNTKSNITAAALDLFAYSLVADYPGPVGSSTNLNYYSQRAGAAAADVRAAEAVIAKQTLANYNKPAASSAEKPVIDIDNTTLKGTVTASVTPTTAPGVLTLTGAKESGTGATVIDITNDQVVDIDVTPTPNEAMRYTVTASVTWTVPGVPQSQLRKYHTDSPKYAQIDMAPAGNKSMTITRVSFADDPRPQTFAPVLATKLTKRAFDPGETIDDILSADVAVGSGPWLHDEAGNWMPIVAIGTWYRELPGAPLSATPPPTATVVGTSTVTIAGPGDFTVKGPVASLPAFYTVVWTITANNQPPHTLGHLPDDYAWADDFGESDESGVARATIEASTQVSSNAVGIGVPASDSIQTSLGSGTSSWPVGSDGQPVAVPFYGNEYWIAGDVQPLPSAGPPPTATLVSSAVITASSVDRIVGPETAPTVTTDGYLVWQWMTPESDYTHEWTELFAEPSQIIRLTAPKITSKADPLVALTDPASDSVTVLGPDFATALNLRWAAYEQAAEQQPRCDDSTQVFDSANEPLELHGVGTYRMPNPPTFSKYGTYYWVATLTSAADGSVIAQGRCGEPSEATEVGQIGISTTALVISTGGGIVRDTATITGPVPAGASLIFRAYRQNGPLDVCDQSTLAFVSNAVQLGGDGDANSGDVRLTSGRYDWVATAYDRDGAPLQSGICGEPSEKSTVVSTLAHTGWDGAGPWLLVAALSVVLIGLMLLVTRSAANRRSTERTGHR